MKVSNYYLKLHEDFHFETKSFLFFVTDICVGVAVCLLQKYVFF